MPHHRTQPKRNFALTLLIACLMTLLTLTSPAIFAQKAEQEPVRLQIQVSTQNKITVRLLEPEGKTLVRSHVDAFRQTFHGQLTEMHPTARTSNTDKNGVPVFDEMIAEWNAPGLLRGLLREAEFDLKPLLKALHKSKIRMLYVNVLLPDYGGSYCIPGGVTRRTTHVVAWEDDLPTHIMPPTSTSIGYGFRFEDVERTAATLLIILLTPLLITFWLRNRALKAGTTDPTAVWFGFSQATSWLETAFWFVWAGFVFSTQASTLLAFALNIPRTGGINPLTIFVLFLPRGLITVLNAVLAQPVYARIRGLDVSPGDLARRTVWTQAMNYLPANFTWYGVLTLTLGSSGSANGQTSYTTQAFFWFGASYLTRKLCLNRLTALTGARPMLITSGPLRDYVFGMAAHVGVKLRNLILLPAGQMQEANAFASRNNTVLLTDYLLQNMTRREVNAVMGHEMTHLQHRHAVIMRWIAGTLTYVPIFVWIFAQGVIANPIVNWPIWYPLAALCGLPLVAFISRRFEKVADLGACQLTGDPEAMISGLSRLSLISMYPQEWGRVTSGLTTHPSTRRRAQYIADGRSISPKRGRCLRRVWKHCCERRWKATATLIRLPRRPHSPPLPRHRNRLPCRRCRDRSGVSICNNAKIGRKRSETLQGIRLFAGGRNPAAKGLASAVAQQNLRKECDEINFFARAAHSAAFEMRFHCLRLNVLRTSCAHAELNTLADKSIVCEAHSAERPKSAFCCAWNALLLRRGLFRRITPSAALCLNSLRRIPIRLNSVCGAEWRGSTPRLSCTVTGRA